MKDDVDALEEKIKAQQLIIDDLKLQIQQSKSIDEKNREYFIFLEMENNRLANEVAKLKKEKDSLLGSSSWKVTKPLRSFKRHLK